MKRVSQAPKSSRDLWMKFFPVRWLEDPRIRDPHTGVRALTLAQEAAYLRLCLTQFMDPDGLLSKRRAFLVDVVGCDDAGYDTLIAPVLGLFFEELKTGFSHATVRRVWLKAHSVTLVRRAAANSRWSKGEHANAHANADANASCEMEREIEIEKENSVKDVLVRSPSPKRIEGLGGPRPPASAETGLDHPLLPDRTKMEKRCYELIREIAALQPERDPTEILIEAAGWKDSSGAVHSKARVETMKPDHLIRTHHDLKALLRRAKERHATPRR